MKQIDKEKFQQTVEKARVKLGLAYYGHSNNMTVGVNWNGKQVSPNKLTDEQLTLLFQLANKMCSILGKEQVKRDLLPEEIKKLYAEMESNKSS